ncbi:hypothetical protein CLAIMM_01268 isoform 2 [Cladophialophora immunda]|nr:hypothetical protein CLAIMM_01268 isoform 2 [Cladophialophora immunda]
METNTPFGLSAATGSIRGVQKFWGSLLAQTKHNFGLEGHARVPPWYRGAQVNCQLLLILIFAEVSWPASLTKVICCPSSSAFRNLMAEYIGKLKANAMQESQSRRDKTCSTEESGSPARSIARPTRSACCFYLDLESGDSTDNRKHMHQIQCSGH